MDTIKDKVKEERRLTDREEKSIFQYLSDKASDASFITFILTAIQNLRQDLEKQINGLDNKITDTKQDLQKQINGLDNKITDAKHDLDNKITDTKQDLQKQIADTKHDLEKQINGLDNKITDTKQSIKEVSSKIDRLLYVVMGGLLSILVVLFTR